MLLFINKTCKLQMGQTAGASGNAQLSGRVWRGKCDDATWHGISYRKYSEAQVVHLFFPHTLEIAVGRAVRPVTVSLSLLLPVAS